MSSELADRVAETHPHLSDDVLVDRVPNGLPLSRLRWLCLQNAGVHQNAQSLRDRGVADTECSGDLAAPDGPCRRT